MRAVIQRVSKASVTINNTCVASIQTGLLVLVGFEESDSVVDFEWAAKKILAMRICNDVNNVMNLSITDVMGELLVVSQFTLYASTQKGNRPSYIKAAKPEKAIPLFEYFKSEIGKSGLKIESGIFGADMKVSLLNDGPVTLVLDSITKA